MKITFLTPLYWPTRGGVQAVTELMGRYLAKQGHEVCVVTSQFGHHDETHTKSWGKIVHFQETETRQGVLIRRFPAGGPAGPVYRMAASAARRLRLPFETALSKQHWLSRFNAAGMLGYLRAHPPDILLVVPYADWLLETGLHARRQTHAKLVMKTALHISASGFESENLARLKECDAIFTNTSAESKFLEQAGVPAEKLVELGEFMDVEKIRSITPAIKDAASLQLAEKKFVLYLGRKENGKGIDELVKVFESSPPELRDVSLVLAGEPTRYFDAEIQPRLKKVPAAVVLGEVDEAAKYWLLQHCAVYSMVSNVDSYGLTYLEAWLSGAPVVAADVPAMRDVVQDGTDGLLVPYGDERRLKEALVSILSDSNKAKRLAEAGQRKVLERFSDFAPEKKFEKVLEKLL